MAFKRCDGVSDFGGVRASTHHQVKTVGRELLTDSKTNPSAAASYQCYFFAHRYRLGKIIVSDFVLQVELVIRLFVGQSLNVQRGFSSVIIAPHARLAARHGLSFGDVVPAVRAMVNRMQNQAMMRFV